MLSSAILAKASRNWKFLVMAGFAGFAAGIAAFILLGCDWIVAALTAAPAPVSGVVMALPFGLGAAALAGLFVTGRRRAQARLLRAALNNMTQGLCMFDSAARLVLCNDRYIEMYRLPPIACVRARRSATCWNIEHQPARLPAILMVMSPKS